MKNVARLLSALALLAQGVAVLALTSVRAEAMPGVTLYSPNGGEVYHVGTTYNILWDYRRPTGSATAKVELSQDGGATWSTIASGISNNGVYAWAVGFYRTTRARIRVTAMDGGSVIGSDASDADFEIRDVTSPSVLLLSPNGGEVWDVGSTQTIRWTATDASQSVSIDLAYSLDRGASWRSVVAGLANSGSYLWTVPNVATPTALIRVDGRDPAGNVGSDVSDVTLEFRDPNAPRSIVSMAGPNGSISPMGEGWVSAGSDQTFIITPDRGYHVDDVLVDGVSVGPVPSYTFFDVSANHTIAASFAVNTYTLTVATAGPGAVTKNPDQPLYNYGTSVELTATPSTGFDFAGWSGDAYGSANPFTVVVDTNKTVTATFVPQTYIITASAGPEGTITPAGLVPVTYGSDQTFAIEPGTGFHVDDVRVDRVSVGAVTSYTFTDVDRPHSIEASFALNPYTLSVTVVGSGRVGRNPDLTRYEHGSIVEVTAFPDSGHRFTGWSGDVSDSANPLRLVMDGDKHLTATFVQVIPIDPTKRVYFRADSADGTHPAPGAASPWVDLVAPRTDGTLAGFDGSSGWQGDGSAASPYRLEFDGVDDRVTIPAGSVSELQSVSAVSAEMWVKPGTEILSNGYYYLLEWLQQFGTWSGMSLAIHDGKLQIYLANPDWAEVAPVSPDVWYHIVATKEPGEVRVYLNGTRVFAASTPNLGDQTSEVVIGASTWRGAGNYGDFFAGAIGSLCLWQGALDDSQVVHCYISDSPFGPNRVAGVDESEGRLSLAGFRSNPMGRSLRISLSLASSAPARLELFDVAGRRVQSREVGSLGPGNHVVDLGDAVGIESGVYFLRLTQGQQSVSAKATLLR